MLLRRFWVAPNHAEAYRPRISDDSICWVRSPLTQSNNTVRILTVERDRYGRTIAEVISVLGESEMNLNAQMVADGMAYHYAQYSGNCPSRAVIAEAEANAKSSRVGVWADSMSVKPWEWRQRN